ncbi:kynureninase [Phaffia rhodozyma]|uniref:Kynureninase n=1 Tax=Phaffia rhodozyma TaxID=264483 RepID=A0A0F7SWQ0_PHARH|nr:kynureninase [Phaffia rhodozyma]
MDLVQDLLSKSSHELNSPQFAALLAERAGPTGHAREAFQLPKKKDMGASLGDLDEPCVYMAGNSLGLQPTLARELIQQEMDVWSSKAVLGHFDHPHDRPWKSIDDKVVPALKAVVGASTESEVACTSTLTSNLHNLFVTFFRPEGKRTKILVEGKAFPSDQYAVQSQLDLHSLDSLSLIELFPREGEGNLRTEDILSVIEEQGDEIALVWLSGVQYYTGQVFDMESIAKAGKTKNCIVGFDLAHAVGNVPLKLHDWNVDFAVWCSYKYLNSGPGAVGGMFVHSKWDEAKLPRLSGWWGHDKTTRFTMPSTFKPIAGAQGYQHSNPPLLSLIPLIASLETLNKAGGLPAVRIRSTLLTGYLLLLLRSSKFFLAENAKEDKGREVKIGFAILTPENEQERGAQLSLKIVGRGGREGGGMKRVFEGLVRRGVVGDEREPEVIRISPIPLYNTFEDVRQVVSALDKSLEEESQGIERQSVDMIETS